MKYTRYSDRAKPIPGYAVARMKKTTKQPKQAMEKSKTLPDHPKRSAVFPRSLLLFFLLLIAAITLAAGAYYQIQKKAERKTREDELRAIADLKCVEIQKWISERLGDTNMISQNPILVEKLEAFILQRSNPPDRELILTWMDSLMRNYEYHSVLLIDLNGGVKLSTGKEATVIGANGKKSIATARQAGTAVLSDFHVNPPMPHPHLDLTVPLSKHGLTIGYILMRIDPATYLYPIIDSWPEPSASAETALVRIEGDDILYLNNLRHRRGMAMKLRLPLSTPDLPPAEFIRNKKSGIIAGRDYRGIPVWSVVRRIRGTGWLIVVKIDEKEIMAPLRSRATLISLVALLMMSISAGLFLFLMQRQATRQNAEIAEAYGLLKQAQNEVKRLEGMLPICASCKRIRDEKGQWHAVEEYIHERTEVDFSHSICPECVKKLYK